MKKKILIIVLMLIIYSTSCNIQNQCYASSGRILIVDDDAEIDPDNLTWNTISDALDHAKRMDTINVYNGTYFENLNIDKDVDIIGQSCDLYGDDLDGIIIDGGLNSDVISITSYGVFIKGISVENSGDQCAGFNIQSYSTTIEKCGSKNNHFGILCDETYSIILSKNNLTNNNEAGIYLRSSYNDLTIYDNTISYNGAGILCDQITNAFISNNHIHNNQGAAIYMTHNSINNEIHRNKIENNSIGIELWWSSNNNIISENIITNSSETGIYTDFETSIQTSNLLIEKNKLFNNSEGIYLYHVKGAEIIDNNISGSLNGIYCEISNYSDFNKNALLNNNIGIYQNDCIGNKLTNNKLTIRLLSIFDLKKERAATR